MLALFSMLSLVGPLSLARPSAAATRPQQPQTVNTAFVAPTGKTISVKSGDNLQAAIDAAQPGDVISLQAGATFTGNFTLPNKSGSGWITIETSAIGSLPASGTRVSPSNASAMPKIVTTNSTAALATEAGAHNYRIVGVEFALNGSMTYGLVALGDASSAQSSLYQVPHDLILDRVYIHGSSSNTVRRGVALNSASTGIIDSYISDIHEAGADTQAIGGWNGPGPYKIDNNYLEAAGENILFGGADPSVPNLVPSDITITHNYVKKQTSWRNSSWQVKNLLELKNAQRVLIDGNVFEYNWPAAQNGFSILFTVRNQDGTAPWSIVQDVAFTRNIVRHVAAAVNLLGIDNLQRAQQEQRILIQNNLFSDVGGQWGGNGRLFQVLDNVGNLTIDHNTGVQTGDPVVASGAATSGMVFTNNIVENGQYGVSGDGHYGDPMGTIAAYFPGVTMQGNAFVGASASKYPAGNFFPASDGAVAFTSDYALTSSSTLRGAGTDGKDVGVDSGGLSGATQGVTNGSGGSGSGSSTPNPPVDDPPPATGGGDTGGGDTGGGNTGGGNTGGGNTGGGDTTTPPADGGQTDPGTGGQSGSFAWANLRNATASGNSLRKTSGCNGCQDAGGLSKQSVSSGDLVLTFSADGSTTQREIGLTNGSSENVSGINFGLMLWPDGGVSVHERGAYRTETRSAKGDTLGIAIRQGKVVYLKNGTVFYQSSASPSYPLRASAALMSMGATATNVALVAGSTATSGGDKGDTPGGTTSPGGDTTTGGNTGTSGGSDGVQPVKWTHTRNVRVSDNSLQKTAGCNGCQDAGAITAQSIASGDGALIFSLDQLNGQREVGFVNGTSYKATAISFGLMVWPDGGVSVEENGIYKTDTRGAVGDTLAIVVQNGVVFYQKNGRTFYQSSKRPQYPLVGAAVLLTHDTTAANVMLAEGDVPTASLRTATGDTLGTAVRSDVTASQRGTGGN
jgi:hypothetical protein